METGNNIDHVFRSKSKEIKIKPSEEVWTKIDSNLSKRNRYSFYAIFSVAASAVLLVGIIALYSLRTSPYENNNYQVQLIQEVDNQAYEIALKDWIDFNRHIKG